MRFKDLLLHEWAVRSGSTFSDEQKAELAEVLDACLNSYEFASLLKDLLSRWG